MNRLAFGEFHAKHFGPSQVTYWQSMLQQTEMKSQEQGYSYASHEQNNQQQYNSEQDHHNYGFDQHDRYNQHEQYPQTTYDQYDHTEHSNEYISDQEEEYEENYSDQQQLDQNEYQLSKEAIEIFRFSEAYRQERAEERQKQEEIEKEGMEDWQFDESTVHVSGGMEAPTTSLVLTKKNSQAASNNIKISEDLLNSAYLASCQDGVAPVLWPVLPFRM